MRWPAFDRGKWHSWFSWYPTCIDGIWVWWETIEVRLDHSNEAGNWWEYRFPVAHTQRNSDGG